MTTESWRTSKETAAQRGYGGKWQREREAFLQKHPLCVFHKQRGEIVAATVVDHKIPHRGDQKLFWDRKNWQSLCKPCHDSVKRELELSGRTRGCDAHGIPIDAGHHWNRPSSR